MKKLYANGKVAEYPPSSAIQIAIICGQIARMRDLKGAVSEPEWRNAIGVIKHCKEGDDLAHEWSEGDYRYDYDQTQEKIDGWSTGPTTCETFELTASHICKGCKLKGKYTSPVELGYVALEETPLALVQPEGVDESIADCPKFFPKDFYWDERSKQMNRLVEDKNGVSQWIAFSDTLFYPTTRIKLKDDTWGMRLKIQLATGCWRVFDLPSKYLTNASQTRTQLAAHEIVIHPKMGRHVLEYLINWLNHYKEADLEL